MREDTNRSVCMHFHLYLFVCLLVANQVRLEMKYGVSNNGLLRGGGVTPVCPNHTADLDVLSQYLTNAIEISILLSTSLKFD